MNCINNIYWRNFRTYFNKNISLNLLGNVSCLNNEVILYKKKKNKALFNSKKCKCVKFHEYGNMWINKEIGSVKKNNNKYHFDLLKIKDNSFEYKSLKKNNVLKIYDCNGNKIYNQNPDNRENYVLKNYNNEYDIRLLEESTFDETVGPLLAVIPVINVVTSSLNCCSVI